MIGHCLIQLMQTLFNALALISWAHPFSLTWLGYAWFNFGFQFLLLCPWMDVCRSLQTSFLWKRWSPLLGSVAVRVSGRFNNSCYRINFRIRENQDSTWRCASFASEFGLSCLACHGACRRVLVHLKSLERCSNSFKDPEGVIYLVCFRWLLEWDVMLWVWKVTSCHCFLHAVKDGSNPKIAEALLRRWRCFWDKFLKSKAHYCTLVSKLKTCYDIHLVKWSYGHTYV